jgi:hypothetical protein
MHALHRRALLVGVLLAGTIACAAHDGFRLIHPPAAPDDQYPGGYRLLTTAPLADWPVEGQFGNRAACEQARQAAIQTTITQAHTLVGEAAKHDLGVRRAVNARCVLRARLETPES